MRIATVAEILWRFEVSDLKRWTKRSRSAISQWKARNRIPADCLVKIQMQNPWVMVVDDEGTPYWLEECNYEIPEWIPIHWWMTYTHMRQRNNLGVADDQLDVVVEKLDEIRSAGGDISLSLRHASKNKLTIPMHVERR